MQWTKLLYVLIIALIYVPMVFLGANVFFPKYTGADSYYHGPYQDCYQKYPYSERPDTLAEAERLKVAEDQQKCNEEFQKAQQAWEEEKRAYDSWKYVFIAFFNLIILMGALFIQKLDDSVILGLFVGSIIATFAATISYFQTNSRLGFGLLVLTFIAVVYFVHRKKGSFWEK